MSGIWGNNIKYSIFGESHGEAIGIVIDGLPPGLSLDLEDIRFEMARRSPGKTSIETPRREKDEFRIISGYFNNKTTGVPLTVLIENTNKRSKDYEKPKGILRPGHADYTAYMKYKGFQDYRGGGHFSGRLTAPIVFAGAVAKQILRLKDIYIGSHVNQIGNLYDERFSINNVCKESFENLKKMNLPVLNEKIGERMKDLILEVKGAKDSIGGSVEVVAINVPAGFGSPFFDSVESILSHLMFSIPAVKGVEFGSGFEISRMRGSEANDIYYLDKDEIKTRTNNNGGILGGITNGMPIVIRVAFKPTSSIGMCQRTVDYLNRSEVDLRIEGRHDPCIVPRAVPVVEAMAAIGLLEFLINDI
jgi:chorismate synthase